MKDDLGETSISFANLSKCHFLGLDILCRTIPVLDFDLSGGRIDLGF